jgi:hypothetical protein
MRIIEAICIKSEVKLIEHKLILSNFVELYNKSENIIIRLYDSRKVFIKGNKYVIKLSTDHSPDVDILQNEPKYLKGNWFNSTVEIMGLTQIYDKLNLAISSNSIHAFRVNDRVLSLDNKVVATIKLVVPLIGLAAVSSYVLEYQGVPIQTSKELGLKLFLGFDIIPVSRIDLTEEIKR